MKERDLEFPNSQIQLDLAKTLLKSTDRSHLLEAQDTLDGNLGILANNPLILR
jgi:hypothetical protein